MANLTEADQWEAGIYQLEEDDPVLGGPTGIDNRPPRELANRTGYLRRRGVSPWDATLSYPANVAYVSYGGTTWKSVGDSTNVAPGSDPAKWVRWAFTAAELAVSLGDAVAAHEAKTDPHPQYVNDAEMAAGIAAHEAKTDPHPQYVNDAEMAAGIAAHEAKPNPHGQYVRSDAAQGLTNAQALQARNNIGVEAAGTTLALIQKNAPMFAIDTGAANAMLAAFTPAITALVDGIKLWVKAKAANTGNTTIKVDGLGPFTIVGLANTALEGAEISTNGICELVWNATFNVFVLIGCTGGELQVLAASKGSHAVRLDQFLNTKALTGIQRLPNGLILQWGLGTIPPNSGGAGFTWPVAFPNACLRATVSDTGGTAFTFGIGNYSTTAFAVWRSPTTTGDAVFQYVAIGW
jgi:hypothetical protein